ncbi:MAG TPA: M15 family metallopeptidase [Candidatus Saccharimonadales bacterium]|nr:M15 family metallopeptidase [Candidatus Saccharimonadales bacterium]
MKRQDIYRLLEEKMLNYTDYANVPVEPTNEPLVPIPTSTSLTARQIDAGMLAYTGEQVFVRQTVLQKLKQAAELLATQDNRLQLEVVYGYRALEIQRRLFEEQKSKLSSKYSDKELLAAVHRLVAVPEVAGHPAGAAVDIQIARSGKPLDFGTKVHEFVPDTFTFSPFIGKEAWDNRQLLRRVMLQAGFAPFDGEWWHFSYGDKEWAKYDGKQAAMYQQLNFRG